MGAWQPPELVLVENLPASLPAYYAAELHVVFVRLDHWRRLTLSEREALYAHEAGHAWRQAVYDAREANAAEIAWLEARAERTALTEQIPDDAIEEAIADGCSEPWQFAEHWGVPGMIAWERLELWRKRIGAAVVVAALLLPAAPALAQQGGCPGFATQAAAQDAYRGNPALYSDLDRDRDGIACESNPCPCDRTPVLRASVTPATATPIPSPSPTRLPPTAVPPTPTLVPSPTPIPTAAPVPTVVQAAPAFGVTAANALAEPAPESAPAAATVPTTDAWAMVLRVVDGDTIDVQFEDGGATARVRLTLINTPETVDPRRPVQCYGTEASARARELLEGRRVWLERDVSQTDRFGRLLRYAWLDETTLAQRVLVAEGFARVSTFPPDIRYVDDLRAAEREAREAGRGLWSACQ